MMYQKKFVVALKSANGQVLREFDRDKVYLPFGSEYSIFLKNMHDRRAVAQISIDGKDIGNGFTFVIPAYGQLDVERFIKNGNLCAGNRFKFIERTDKVAAHSGIGVEDGLIRVTFQLEQVWDLYPTRYYLKTTNKTIDEHPPTIFSGDNSILYNHSRKSGIQSRSFVSTSADTNQYCSTNEVGITSTGTISDQSFTLSENFLLENEKTVFVFQVLGETENNRTVNQPVTVKSQCKCEACGTVNAYNANFCSCCGSCLQRV